MFKSVLFITTYRVFKSGIKNIARNPLLSIAATMMMVVTLLMISFFFFSAIIVKKESESINQRNDVSISINDNATQAEIDILKSKIQSIGSVKSIRLVTKEEQLEKSKGEFGAIIQELEKQNISNPLQASLEIDLLDNSTKEAFDNIDAIVRSNEFSTVVNLDSIDSQKNDISKRIKELLSFVNKFSIVITLCFMGVSILIIFNTIKMAIFSRREEIEIMQLVGATSRYIRGPFLVEGMIYGLIGGIILTIILITSKSKLISALNYVSNSSRISITNIAEHNLGLILILITIMGILIGLISSYMATRKYLRLR
jgi:cell division transport system permease protein